MEEPYRRTLDAHHDRPFHLIKQEYATHTLDRAIKSGLITLDDRDLIEGYVFELQSTRNISTGRANKLIYALVNWRHHLGPYRQNTQKDLFTGLARLKTSTVHGHPYRQNTVRDYIIFLNDSTDG